VTSDGILISAMSGGLLLARLLNPLHVAWCILECSRTPFTFTSETLSISQNALCAVTQCRGELADNLPACITLSVSRFSHPSPPLPRHYASGVITSHSVNFSRIFIRVFPTLISAPSSIDRLAVSHASDIQIAFGLHSAAGNGVLK